MQEKTEIYVCAKDLKEDRDTISRNKLVITQDNRYPWIAIIVIRVLNGVIKRPAGEEIQVCSCFS
jgi:hypothetical protein